MGSDSVAQRFSGKSAIVTGAGSGIGRATAKRLAQEGARVIATDAIQARLDELADELRHNDITFVQGDITREETVAALVAAAHGRIDVLANVAGIMDGFLPVGELDDATWERVFGDVRAHFPPVEVAFSGSRESAQARYGVRVTLEGRCHTVRRFLVLEGMKPRMSPREAVLAAVVLLHLGVSLVHGLAHARARVTLSPGSMLFVVTVILIGPTLGLIVQRLALPRVGAWIMAVTLGGALAFGLANHFLISGADHVSHVAEPWRVLFGASAALLVATEATGSAMAVWCATSLRRAS